MIREEVDRLAGITELLGRAWELIIGWVHARPKVPHR